MTTEKECIRLKLLRIMLLFSAFGWGISIFGVILPWSQVVIILNSFNIEIIPDTPMLAYWVKMGAGAFSFIGLLFVLFAINPQKYKMLISIAALFMFAEGILLLVCSKSLGLPLYPFGFDFSFCIFSGLGIFLLNHSIREK